MKYTLNNGEVVKAGDRLIAAPPGDRRWLVIEKRGALWAEPVAGDIRSMPIGQADATCIAGLQIDRYRKIPNPIRAAMRWLLGLEEDRRRVLEKLESIMETQEEAAAAIAAGNETVNAALGTISRSLTEIMDKMAKLQAAVDNHQGALSPNLKAAVEAMGATVAKLPAVAEALDALAPAVEPPVVPPVEVPADPLPATPPVPEGETAPTDLPPTETAEPLPADEPTEANTAPDGEPKASRKRNR